eukprot:CAMPEP_0114541110 /NCGR_PEP_ID=MMETSP0114-20121206/1129_1 /TAXON_ID=31324 /ORGANISM="Goniomonas sp, Strain m" /LENGTH=87 /DNA_ID=CAMNT_0001725323 /DNA_START=325 /DNA_END=589 /DNA_ORIENTATION=+
MERLEGERAGEEDPELVSAERTLAEGSQQVKIAQSLLGEQTTVIEGRRVFVEPKGTSELASAADSAAGLPAGFGDSMGLLCPQGQGS